MAPQLRIPSLPALRAFEAVARNLSFTKAAEELRLTQGAISYQIKQLEREIGIRLFYRRRGHEIQLSSKAGLLLPTVQRAFAELTQSINAIRVESEAQPVVIALSTYFAAHWLLRRLGRFWRVHHSIKLRLQHPETVAAPDVHVTIHWRKEDWTDEGLVTDLLFVSEVSPVCSPSLALTKPKDLLRHTLLRDEVTNEAWTGWLKKAGLSDGDAMHAINTNDPNVYIQAAIDGQGVALGDDLIEDEISLGRLARPFNIKLKGYCYFSSYRPDVLRNPSVAAFRNWLLAEAGEPVASNPSHSSSNPAPPRGKARSKQSPLRAKRDSEALIRQVGF